MIHHPTKPHVPVTSLHKNTNNNSNARKDPSFRMIPSLHESLDSLGGCPAPSDTTKPVDDDDDDENTKQASTRIANLQAQVEALQQQLKESQSSNEKKDQEIITLQNRVGHKDEWIGRKDNLADKLLADYLQGRMEKKQVEMSNKTLTAMPHVRDTVDDIQRWLFTKGAGMKDVKTLIVEYCIHLRSIGLPLDRLAVSGMMFHNDVTAHKWKWEHDRAFLETDIPQGRWQRRPTTAGGVKPDATFAALWELNVREFRMTRGDGAIIPPELQWFEIEEYEDYLALPVFHRGDYTGKISWATKNKDGFSKENLEVIRRAMTAFSTVLRLHTNEIVVSTLTGRLEEEVARQTQELASANTRLAEANEKVIRQYQNQLKHFAMMSHEIRTPLNCIVGLSNLLLEEEDLNDEAREQIELITESSDLLLAVVNDVLDYSKLATGRVDTCIQPTDIRKTLASVVATVRAQAQQVNIEIRERIEADIPDLVLTDGRRIQQVIFNLLGNAVKFGKTGKYVEFNVGVYPGNALGTKEYLKFSIKDYGKGISKDDMANIFQPFQQSSSNDVTHGGTGLGLAITRQLVRVLGGSISVDSELGNWSEFVVKLPCVRHHDGRRLSRLIMQPLAHSQSNHTLGDDSESYFDDDDDSTSSASYYSSMSTTTNADSQLTGSYSTTAYGSSVASRPISPVPPVFYDALKTLHGVRTAPPPVAAVSITETMQSSNVSDRADVALTPKIDSEKLESSAPSPLFALLSAGTSTGEPKSPKSEPMSEAISSEAETPKAATAPLFTESPLPDGDFLSEGQECLSTPLFPLSAPLPLAQATKSEDAILAKDEPASTLAEEGKAKSTPIAPLFDLSAPKKALQSEAGHTKSAPAPLFALVNADSANKSGQEKINSAPVSLFASLSNGTTSALNEHKSAAAPLFAISTTDTTDGTKPAPAPLFAILAKDSDAEQGKSKSTTAPLFALSAAADATSMSGPEEPKSGPAPLFALSATGATAKPERDEPKSAPAPLFPTSAVADASAKPGSEESKSTPAPLFALSSATHPTAKSESEESKSTPNPLFALSAVDARPESGLKEPKSAAAPLFDLSTAGTNAKSQLGEPKAAPVPLFALSATTEATAKSEPKSTQSPLFALPATNTTTAKPDREEPSNALVSLFDITAQSETPSSSVRTPDSPDKKRSSPVSLFAPIEKPIGLPENPALAPAFITSPRQAGSAKKSFQALRPRKVSDKVSEEERLDDLKILVAEDNMINQKVLNRTLARIGLKDITVVENGLLAVEATEKRTYDIILMDLQMPVMDGLEATKIITTKRDEEQQSHPKVIFLTAHALSDYKEQADEAGGDGFISKPYKVGIIKDAIVELRPKQAK